MIPFARLATAFWLLAAVAIPLAAWTHSAEGADSEEKPAEPAPEEDALQLPEVLGGAAADLLDLREFESAAQGDTKVEEIDKKLSELEQELPARVTEAAAAIKTAKLPRELQELEIPWQRQRGDLEGWRKKVTNRALVLQGEIEKVDGFKERWEWVEQEAVRLDAPRSVSARAREMLQAIQATREAISERWSESLRVEGRVGTHLATVDDLLEESANARAAIQQALLARGPVPLWTALQHADIEGRVSLLPELLWQNTTRLMGTLGDFPTRNRGRLLLQGLILVLTVALALALRPQAQRWAAEDESLQATALLLSRPFAAGVLVTALTTFVIHPNPPRVVLFALGLVALLAILRLVPSLLAAAARPAFYALMGLYLVERLRELLQGADLAERLIFDAELALLTGGLAWILRRDRGALGLSRSARINTVVRWLMWSWLGLSALALASSIVGYVELAHIMGEGAIRAGFGALVFFAAYRILAGIASITLRSPALQGLNIVRHERAAITRRLVSALRLGMAASWAVLALRVFTIEATVYSAIGSFFAASFSVGEVEVSLGDLGWLVLTIAASVYLSRFVRFVLEEDVVSRLDLPRGVPRAISTTTGYVVLFLGFLLAFAAAGFDMSRFTILAGAFGVGLGFGLQNVVNNFVSGLILVFERPIQIGDTIELPDLLGDVRRIGIRSSTIRTFQGAEVIVPNADLISSRVTNWTLSDKRRRIELAVGVAYGTDPKQVIEILLKVAAEDERVLKDPESTALFLGFGESSLDFQLRAWTAQSDRWMAIRSDLTVAVNRALAEARIAIPFPQRDLHLRSVDEKARAPTVE